MDEWRGHKIYESGGAWYYLADDVPVADEPNPVCGFCERANTDKGHDWCISDLPDVRNACCGHGNRHEAYAVFNNGTRISGSAVFQLKRIQQTYSPLGNIIIAKGAVAVAVLYPIVGFIECLCEAFIAFADCAIRWRGNYRSALFNAKLIKAMKKRKPEEPYDEP